jgi:hypothetical protein
MPINAGNTRQRQMPMLGSLRPVQRACAGVAA